jgi:hypothetical protein
MPTPQEDYYKHVAVADLSAATSVTAFTGPCLVKAVYINNTLSAHSFLIRDNGIIRHQVPPSISAGTLYELFNTKIDTSLTLSFNASATGSITLIIYPLVDGTTIDELFIIDTLMGNGVKIITDTGKAITT